MSFLTKVEHLKNKDEKYKEFFGNSNIFYDFD